MSDSRGTDNRAEEGTVVFLHTRGSCLDLEPPSGKIVPSTQETVGGPLVPHEVVGAVRGGCVSVARRALDTRHGIVQRVAIFERSRNWTPLHVAHVVLVGI